MKKVNIQTACREYVNGKDVLLVPNKCGLGSMFECTVNRSQLDSADLELYPIGTNFIRVVNQFKYYMNSELGNGIKYYIKD